MEDLGPLGLELFFTQMPENPIFNECALKSYSIPVPVLIFFSFVFKQDIFSFYPYRVYISGKKADIRP